MTFHGAVIREQGLTFAVVVVEPRQLRSTLDATRAQISFASVFPGMPIILMAQDATGFPTFHGRKDLVAFLSTVPLDAITWSEYSHGR